MLKKNVDVFNRDVAENAGYRYTTNAPYSAEVANARQTEATVKVIDRYDARRVIDVGCGDGAYTAELRRQCPGIDILGVDAATAAVDLARSRYPGIAFRVANVLDPASLPTGPYDLAVVRGVLHHLARPEAAIANLRHLARRLLIIEPNGNNGILKIIEKTSRYHIEHEERSFTSRRLRRWCRDAGFRVCFLEYIGFVPFFFPDLPARAIHAVQPWLERLPVVTHLFAAQIVILCEA